MWSGDEAAVLDHEHPGRGAGYPRPGVRDGVEERGDRVVAHGVRADGPAPPRARGQRGGQGVGVPHQLAEVTGPVVVGPRHRRRLHASVEDELQAPDPQQAIACAWPDPLLLQGIEVGVHRAGGRDGRGRGHDHGVAADGQLPARLGANVGVPLGWRDGGVPHGADPVRRIARGSLAEAADQGLLGKRRQDPLGEFERRVLDPAARIAGRVPVDEAAFEVRGAAADPGQAQPGGVEHPVVAAALQEHRVIRRGLVELGGGGQAAFREPQLMPVGGGADPLARAGSARRAP